MQVLLFTRVIKEHHKSHVVGIVDLLKKNGVELYFTPEIWTAIDNDSDNKVIATYEELKASDVEVIITLGGDGTILQATTMIHDLEIPLLGINLGRLGFLAGVEIKNIQSSIESFLLGNYRIDKRSMLFLESNYPLFADQKFALNDFTLHKRDTSSMITIKAYINGDLLNSYWSDGIIVATPTGSTAYSLSCGGPIIFPGSGNFVLTPVAPHNLNVRPIVISDNSIISFEIEGRSKNFLCTLDSRFETITTKHQLAIRKADFKTNLIQVNDNTFLRTLRNKISWGTDARN